MVGGFCPDCWAARAQKGRRGPQACTARQTFTCDALELSERRETSTPNHSFISFHLIDRTFSNEKLRSYECSQSPRCGTF